MRWAMLCDVLDLNWFISNDKLNFDTIHGTEMTNRQIPYFYGRKIWKLYRRAFDNDQRPSHTYARLTYIDPRSRPNADDMTHRRVTFSHFRTTAAIIRGAYELRVTNASDVVINDPRMHQPKFIQSRRIGYNNINVSNESAASKIALLILLFHYKKINKKCVVHCFSRCVESFHTPVAVASERHLRNSIPRLPSIFLFGRTPQYKKMECIYSMFSIWLTRF